MLPYIDVLARLSHTQFCSGQVLAETLGVTRATIHNCILRIVAMGIAIERVRGKGYKLVMPLDLLDQQIIQSKLSRDVSACIADMNIVQQTPSTNDTIAGYALPGERQFSVLLAEMQTAGRGRRGRAWVSPYAVNIYLSVLFRLQKPLNELGVISPLLAVCIVRALAALGVTGLGLKWPNDIYCHDKKLAGLLIDCSGEITGVTKMIIGVGVNVKMSQQTSIDIDQQWTDIITHLEKQTISRNDVAACLLNYMLPTLNEFDGATKSSSTREWVEWDILRDKSVILHTANEQIAGVARGIDQSGCLLLETDAGMQHISAGDVSLRAQ